MHRSTVSQKKPDAASSSRWNHFKRAWFIFQRLLKIRKNAILAWPKTGYTKELLTFRVFRTSLFIINHPPSIQWVMATNGKNYQKSAANTQTLKPLLGNGLFVSEGELWARQRRIASPFTHKNRFPVYSEIIIEEGKRSLDQWSRLAAGAELDVTESFTLLTAEIISRIMFGFRLGEKRVQELFEAFKEYQASHGRGHILELCGVPTWFPRLSMLRGRRAVRRFDRVLMEILEFGKNSDDQPPPDNLLQMLLSYRDESGQPMPLDLVRDEMASIFLAGHETTAITLSWAFYLIEKHPAVEAALHEEIERVLMGREATFEDFPKLVYTRAVIDETLRLYPPVHVFVRQAIHADEIMGKHVPAGSVVIVASWLLHRHKLLWKEPKKFIPERFLPETKEKIHPFGYIPFGAGSRICLGKHLGIAEAVLLLAMTAQKFRLRLKPGHLVEPLGRMTLRPEYGMPMTFEPRNR